jgi:uncharacterized protein
MPMTSLIVGWLGLGGLTAGILAGLLGIGGGALVVPLLLALGYNPTQAVATSSWAMIITALSGTVQNWRMGLLDRSRLLGLGMPAIALTQLGVWLSTQLPQSTLLVAFGLLMCLNIYLITLRHQLVQRLESKSNPQQSEPQQPRRSPLPPWAARSLTGGLAGLLAGLLGVGGGAIMVPLQMLLLGEPIKRAIQTSLGVVVLTAIAATLGHARQGHVGWMAGLVVGLGGLVGAQGSARLLPKLPDLWVSRLFTVFLVAIATYSFWKAAKMGGLMY